MKLETLKKNNLKKGILIVSVFMVIVIAIVINTARAKYKVVDSVKLVNSTINYSSADFSLIALYLQKGSVEEPQSGYDKIPNGIVPTKDVVLNVDMTFCKVGDDTYTGKTAYESQGIHINYDGVELDFKGITNANTKCTVYFDLINSNKILAKLGFESQGAIDESFTGTACDNGTNTGTNSPSSHNCTTQDKGVYETEDDYGTSYYFRGTLDNNWVQIGKEYWRIIRINGNGTIRLIYNGTSMSSTSKNMQISTSNFNPTDDNKYVGYMYGGVGNEASTSYEFAHQNNVKSNALKSIESWYTSKSDLKNYSIYLDGATGFCNDRQINETDDDDAWWVSDAPKVNRGYGKNNTAYATFSRVMDANSGTWKSIQTPTLKCGNKKRDLFTTKSDPGYGNGMLDIPIGLITVDEAIYAGAFGGAYQHGYWLSQTDDTGEFLTMSPAHWNTNWAYMFYFVWTGAINLTASSAYIRPVINLKADTPIITNGEENRGTIYNPFVVKLD